MGLGSQTKDFYGKMYSTPRVDQHNIFIFSKTISSESKIKVKMLFEVEIKWEQKIGSKS